MTVLLILAALALAPLARIASIFIVVVASICLFGCVAVLLTLLIVQRVK